MLAAVAAAALIAFSPALFQHRVMTHTDSIIVGLSLMQYHADALHGHASLLWAPGVYGGHALLAEGQGAFLHPLTLLIDALLPPLSGYPLLHLSCTLLAAFGSYRLCRELDLRPSASALAALLVPFSTLWLFYHENLPVSISIAFVPWLLWAFERWWAQPNLRHALALAASAALMVLGGYPQIAHGAGIYLALLLFSRLMSMQQREHLRTNFKPLLATGAFAAALALGLCTAQLLPLLELVPNSHRSGGLGLQLFAGPARYLLGLLLPMDSSEAQQSLGSSLAMLLALMALALRMPNRILGHALCAAFLFVLGMGATTPLYSWMEHSHLIPGLRYFRSAQAYTVLSVVSFAVLAAFAVDRMSTAKNAADVFGSTRNERIVRIVALVLLLGWWLRAYWITVVPNDPTHLTWIFPTLLLPGVVGCFLLKRNGWVAPMAFALLLGEFLVFKLGGFHASFYERSVLDKPETVALIQQDPEYRSYKHFDATMTSLVAMVPLDDPTRPQKMRDALSALGGLTNLLWGVPSVNGYLALESSRADLAMDAMDKEIGNDAPPGQRLLDQLSVRYVSAYRGERYSRNLTSMLDDPGRPAVLLRNDAALPSVRLYADPVAVDSPQQALAALQGSQRDVLAMEGLPANRLRSDHGDCNGTLSVLRRDDTHLKLTSDTNGDCWLFVADAPYPSWKAWINGKRTPIYAAQVLGKAIRLPAGHNTVTMKFVSYSFRLGAAISLIALATLIALSIASLRRRKPAPAP